MKINLTPETYIFGLDMSIAASGLCMMQYSKEEVIGQGVDLLERKPKEELRIDKNVQSVMTYINMPIMAGNEVFVVLEQYPYGKFGKMYDRVEQSGILTYLFRSENIPHITVYPGTLKKWLTGSGNSKKSVIMKELLKKFDKDFDNDNIADAYALCRFGHCLKVVTGNYKNLYYNKNMVNVCKEFLKKQKE